MIRILLGLVIMGISAWGFRELLNSQFELLWGIPLGLTIVAVSAGGFLLCWWGSQKSKRHRRKSRDGLRTDEFGKGRRPVQDFVPSPDMQRRVYQLRRMRGS